MSHSAFPGAPRYEDPDLTQRQRLVFAALIGLHGQTAQPVSSEAIGRFEGISWSGASIRHTLAELEGLGLLARGHVSSGRVPSAEGYAFFVRRELTPIPLPSEMVREVDERLRRVRHDVEQLLTEASRLLSRLTHQLGLAVETALAQARLQSLELAPLGPNRTLMVLGIGDGAVHTLVLELESPIEADDLEEVAAVLNERLHGRTLAEVRQCLMNDELAGRSAVRIVARAAMASWESPASGTLFSAGTGSFASQPEFADGARLAPVLRVLEDGPPLDRLMVETAEGQAAVRVALDEVQGLAGLSLISFPLPGRVRRAVGVLGPLRMDYARCVAAVDVVGSRVAEYL
jgi:heat-inducible transcriptional repressor